MGPNSDPLRELPQPSLPPGPPCDDAETPEDFRGRSGGGRVAHQQGGCSLWADS
jgi:hypothetical protein